MPMAGSKGWTSLFSLLLFFLFVAVMANDRNGGTEQLQSSNNSSMAARNEHAVDDPDAVASMVDMWDLALVTAPIVVGPTHKATTHPTQQTPLIASTAAFDVFGGSNDRCCASLWCFSF
ncbi:hypothetical protein CK203_043880 [Vitis vinifera]|uniref:Uncharacterized protein n=1 Tax=Vitis vinifera TaxID=29760 RepID=A0A438HVE9_VITVI|nr:hypothetical protein CK203_043880 [Vitis vinifera]